MTTAKISKTFRLNVETVEAISEYKKENGLKSDTAAIEMLIKKAVSTDRTLDEQVAMSIDETQQPVLEVEILQEKLSAADELNKALSKQVELLEHANSVLEQQQAKKDEQIGTLADLVRNAQTLHALNEQQQSEALQVQPKQLPWYKRLFN